MTEHDDVRALTARDAIGRVIARYGQLLDDHRWDEFGELFTEDGVWRTADVTLATRPAIVDGLRGMQGPKPGPVKHLSFTPIIDLESSTSARASTDFAVLHFTHGAWSVVSGGRYHDHLVVDGDTWRFAERAADVYSPSERRSSS
jgi:hypothetical protein